MRWSRAEGGRCACCGRPGSAAVYRGTDCRSRCAGLAGCSPLGWAPGAATPRGRKEARSFESGGPRRAGRAGVHAAGRANGGRDGGRRCRGRDRRGCCGRLPCHCRRRGRDPERAGHAEPRPCGPVQKHLGHLVDRASGGSRAAGQLHPGRAECAARRCGRHERSVPALLPGRAPPRVREAHDGEGCAELELQHPAERVRSGGAVPPVFRAPRRHPFSRAACLCPSGRTYVERDADLKLAAQQAEKLQRSRDLAAEPAGWNGCFESLSHVFKMCLDAENQFHAKNAPNSSYYQPG